MRFKKTLLLAFPFAGGSSYCYEFLRRSLDVHTILETIEYPGRGLRSAIPFVRRMDALLSDIIQQYGSVVDKHRPDKVVVYGHSMGAIVGLAFLHALPEVGKKPQLAIFSGCGDPQTTPKKKLSHLNDSDLVDYFVRIGSIPPQIAAEKEMMDYIMPMMRNDIELYESYPSVYSDKLTIPVAVVNGKEDAIAEEDIAHWANETDRDTLFYFLEGHHFFISQHVAAFASLINDLILKME